MVKSWKARSRLYRSQSLQAITHFAAFLEIYKINNLLHRWNPEWNSFFKRKARPMFLSLARFFRKLFVKTRKLPFWWEKHGKTHPRSPKRKKKR